MSTWHYRVLRHPSGDLAVHEVYCDEDGQPDGCTVEPVTFVADASEGLTGITDALRKALADAERRPILEYATFGPKQPSLLSPGITGSDEGRL